MVPPWGEIRSLDDRRGREIVWVLTGENHSDTDGETLRSQIKARSEWALDVILQHGYSVDRYVEYSARRALPPPKPFTRSELISYTKETFFEDRDDDSFFGAIQFNSIKYPDLKVSCNITRELRNTACIERQRSEGGINAMSLYLLRCQTRFTPTWVPSDRNTFIKLIRERRGDTLAILRTCVEVMEHVPIPILIGIDIPENGFKHRVPYIPTAHQALLAHWLGEAAGHLIALLSPKSSETGNPYVRLQPWKKGVIFNGDMKGASEVLSHRVCIDFWDEIILPRLYDLDRTLASRVIRYLIGPHRIIFDRPPPFRPIGLPLTMEGKHWSMLTRPSFHNRKVESKRVWDAKSEELLPGSFPVGTPIQHHVMGDGGIVFGTPPDANKQSVVQIASPGRTFMIPPSLSYPLSNRVSKDPWGQKPFHDMSQRRQNVNELIHWLNSIPVRDDVITQRGLHMCYRITAPTLQMMMDHAHRYESKMLKKRIEFDYIGDDTLVQFQSRADTRYHLQVVQNYSFIWNHSKVRWSFYRGILGERIYEGVEKKDGSYDTKIRPGPKLKTIFSDSTNAPWFSFSEWTTEFPVKDRFLGIHLRGIHLILQRYWSYYMRAKAFGVPIFDIIFGNASSQEWEWFCYARSSGQQHYSNSYNLGTEELKIRPMRYLEINGAMSYPRRIILDRREEYRFVDSLITNEYFTEPIPSTAAPFITPEELAERYFDRRVIGLDTRIRSCLISLYNSYPLQIVGTDDPPRHITAYVDGSNLVGYPKGGFAAFVVWVEKVGKLTKFDGTLVFLLQGTKTQQEFFFEDLAGRRHYVWFVPDEDEFLMDVLVTAYTDDKKLSRKLAHPRAIPHQWKLG